MVMHPWAVVLGALAVGLPVAVHFLTRPRPQSFPLPTIRFVREAIRQRRARHRLRDFTILSLRTLAVILIALAIARPFFSKTPLAAEAETGDAVRVVIVDVSQSMAAVEEGQSAFERARTAAASQIAYRPGLKVNLILAGSRPLPSLTEPSTNFETLREELGKATVLPEALDVNRAVELAAKMLAPRNESDTRKRELVIVSDFQRSNWASADFSPLPEETSIQLQSTAPEATPANLAILSAKAPGRNVLGGTGTVEVEVGNYSSAPQSVTVELTLGEGAYRLEGTCPANRRTVLMQDIPWRQAGWQWGKARLVDSQDALKEDDAAPIAVKVETRPVYALITRQPAHVRPSSSHYLECALVPDSHLGDRALAQVIRMEPNALQSEMLNRADLIVVDHPGKLPAETVTLLAGLLRQGRPVVYVASETIDANNLKLLSEAAGTGLKLPVDFLPPSAGQKRRDLFLASYQKESPPFQVFGDRTSAVVGGLRFAGGLSSRTKETAVADDVLASYGDGSACLVLTSSDAGTLAVLNADLGESNLPTSADVFIPLWQELILHMLERKSLAQAAVCGEPLVVRLESAGVDPSRLRVVGPKVETPSETLGELNHEGLGVVWHWPTPSKPGVYRIEQNENAEVLHAQPVILSAEESQLESLPQDVLETRLAAGRNVSYQSAGVDGKEQDRLWIWLLTACVMCLLGELAALVFFRS